MPTLSMSALEGKADIADHSLQCPLMTQRRTFHCGAPRPCALRMPALRGLQFAKLPAAANAGPLPHRRS